MSAWNFKDLTGQWFGKLFVISRDDDYVSPQGNRIARWKCKCECGRAISVNGTDLRRGTKSCGCLQRISASERLTKHGKCGTRIYRIWKGIIVRCTNSKHHSYKHYGAKGITVCEEWRNFEEFLKWSVANGYNDTLSIDRIDNSEGYCPSNCRWATTTEQANNTSKNHYVTFQGETHTVKAWSMITGISYRTLLDRINKLKWDVERALTSKGR
jgi:hypothetical protein